VVNAENRGDDARQKEREARSRIDYVAVRYENGYTILTFRNKSPVTPVAVTHLDFTISAPQALARIKRVDPPPKEFMAGSRNNIDDVGFTEGYWTATNTYRYSKVVGYHIPPGEVSDFQLVIINPMWAGARFTGDLEVQFSSGDPSNVMATYKLRDVTIHGRRKA
jgi:hypothetical protein